MSETIGDIDGLGNRTVLTISGDDHAAGYNGIVVTDANWKWRYPTVTPEFTACAYCRSPRNSMATNCPNCGAPEVIT